MQKRSLPGVKVFSLDRESIVDRLRATARELGQRCPEVNEVRLFGSLARGDAVPGSDADVLVLLSHSDVPFFERAPRYALTHCGVGVDILAYTRDEFGRLSHERPRFHHATVEDGIELYRRSE